MVCEERSAQIEKWNHVKNQMMRSIIAYQSISLDDKNHLFAKEGIT